jgi:large subunit ribosomal protein L10
LAIDRERKERLVEQYIEMINNSQAMFLTQYTGLSVKDIQNLRAEVSKVDGTYYVTKNTLLRHALEKSGKPAPADLLVGQLATGFALDEVPALAQVLTKFAKDAEHFTVKFGIMGDSLLTAEQIDALAKLPSKDELRAQILGMLQAPARNIAGTIASGVRQVVNVVDAYAKQEAEVETAEA